MARKRIEAEIQPVKEGQRVAYQKVQFIVNGAGVDTRTVGPEGGTVVSAAFDFPDNQTNTVEVLVTPVDQGGQEAPAPAIARESFEGTDTIVPETPDPPTFRLVDGGSEEEVPAPAATAAR